MVGQKLFKTRLCILYRKGQCYRQTCSFAHGDAELRRYNPSSSFNGRRDYHNADLREKLGRQRSPPRDYSSPRSLKKSDWGQRKRQHIDNDSDYSGSLRLSDGAERQSRERKHSDVHDDQLESEIDMLEDHRQQLQMYLEESVQEADSLNSKIEELEMQLSTEKEECKRISSKMKKFVKANIRHARIQDELKRSEDRVERLGDELGSDARAAANEEDMSINILSDEDTLMGPKDSPPRRDGPLSLGPRKDEYMASPSNKRMRFQTDENSKQASWAAGRRVNLGNMRSERWDPHTKSGEKIREEANGMRNYDRKPMPVQRKNLGKKVKDIKSSRMVANMMDEEDEKLDEEANSCAVLVLPPPPPLPSLAQPKGKDESETADVANANDEELVDVDIV